MKKLYPLFTTLFLWLLTITTYAYDFVAKDCNGSMLYFKITPDNTVAVTNKEETLSFKSSYAGYTKIVIPKTVKKDRTKNKVTEISEKTKSNIER